MYLSAKLSERAVSIFWDPHFSLSLSLTNPEETFQDQLKREDSHCSYRNVFRNVLRVSIKNKMEKKSSKPPKPLKILVNLFAKSKKGDKQQRSVSDAAAHIRSSRETVGSRESINCLFVSDHFRI